MVASLEDVIPITTAAKLAHMRRGRAITMAKAAGLLLDWSLPNSERRDWRVRKSEWERLLLSRRGDAREAAKKLERATAGGSRKSRPEPLDPDVTC